MKSIALFVHTLFCDALLIAIVSRLSSVILDILDLVVAV